MARFNAGRKGGTQGCKAIKERVIAMRHSIFIEEGAVSRTNGAMDLHPTFQTIVDVWQSAPRSRQSPQPADDGSLKAQANPTGTPVATRKGMNPWRDRHPKDVPTARCCWVCGKLGGSGFTHALRFAGYRMAEREMGYAHNRCMERAAKQAAEREQPIRP